MTKAQLEAILARHGLRIDQTRGGAGKFNDLYAGTGAPLATLEAACAEIKAGGIQAAVTCVTNPDHPDHRKPMLEILSFWCE